MSPQEEGPNSREIARRVQRQRARCVAAIMETVENLAYPGMEPDARDALRFRIRDEVSRLADMTCAMLVEVVDESSIVNPMFLDLLQQIHDAVVPALAEPAGTVPSPDPRDGIPLSRTG